MLRLSAIPGILNNTAELRNSSNLRRQPRQERVEVGLPHSLPIARSNQARPILLVPTPFALIILRCCPSLLSVPVTLYAVTPASFPRPKKLLSFLSTPPPKWLTQLHCKCHRQKRNERKSDKRLKRRRNCPTFMFFCFDLLNLTWATRRYLYGFVPIASIFAHLSLMWTATDKQICCYS